MVEKTIIETGQTELPSKNTGSPPSPAQRTIVEAALESGVGTDMTADLRTKTIVEDDLFAPASKTPPGGPPAPPTAMIGKVLENKFKIIRKIGDGGMGVVYEAEHLHLKKRFAIKSIRAEFTENPNFQSRFDQEAKTQALLQHPNIIQVTDFLNVDGQYFLVMEYVEGMGLDKVLAQKKIDEDGILSVLKDVLKGLSDAHAKGIVHRDIKPSNILITRDNTAKLMDFGIAMLVEEDRSGRHSVAGTPAYMSPEQITNPESTDFKSDIYSLGIVMYQALVGKRPFDGDTDRQTQMNQVHRDLPPIQSVAPHTAPELARIIEKALKKNPQQRFASCTEFYASIEAYLRQIHLECRSCKFVNRVKNKYALKGEKCEKCGKPLSMKSKFTKIWAAAFAISGSIILIYLLYPWPGKLDVKTTPEDAIVSIDGEEKGNSPLEISLAPGEYKIEIKKEKFEVFFSPVLIRKNQKTALDIKLQKPDELPRLAFEAIKQSYQEASYLCRDLNDLAASKQNLEIAQSIGDSALTDAYRNQIDELEKNIQDGFDKYTHCFQDLKAINAEIRKNAYNRYVQSLADKGGSKANVSIVWMHFDQYVHQGRSDATWKKDIAKFC
ncbi:hypothetical protein DSCO28_21910 [Desulfosarcina ovata subsp. sediminis]|uniref:non-specific serine/threonine protein kinase n=1 Tax=Desulfosarcina ovata subsp. sediminis TaxID=885957 RepID=A0A5K7ZMK8_9BACT|nr:serine/threonine-protein kinase [Desulfosarcina ovata]BBO81625.1 hypothetical protein DSCO28_21910 [Desulfosarcina ovata subsp. sediminis]